ncbi:polysaccharide biosynthesis protein [Aliidiomarina sedimenti]|uniref:Polysaccharide biosynthesis protein n=1 Tax=Aliidiomarina sedimenti TaxID=1933879 RepID=A0ABY0BZG8_9GAMM|nr:polysaccharide biosynthesis protein [Aliidiomarina sedimenti]
MQVKFGYLVGAAGKTIAAVGITAALTLGAFGSGLLLPSSAYAQATPSQAQIEQLRALPREQQEQLARQFGVDTEALQYLGQDERDTQEPVPDDEPVTQDRSTQQGQARGTLLPNEVEAQFDSLESKLEHFGYDMFAGEPSTFAPVTGTPVPSSYIIGIGDMVRVQLFGQRTVYHYLAVNREGYLIIPDVGQVQVAGLTYSSMQELIKHTVEERTIGQQVAVSMGATRSIQVYIVGESHKPGAYTVSSFATVSQALHVSGGFSDIASLRDVQLVRGGEVVTNFDLYDLLIKGDSSADRILQNGDVIFIPPRGNTVAVEGEVNRPAIYEIKGDETFADLLEFAGGAKPDAYMGDVTVRRVSEGRRSVRNLDLSDESTLQADVQGGDHIVLRTTPETVDDAVMLVGAVNRPGRYEWQPGMRISDMLKSSRHDLLEYADLSYGLVVREEGTRRRLQVWQFDVANAIEGKAEDDLELNERDYVLIFSRYQTEEEERQNISDLSLTQDERRRAERRRSLDAYRQAYIEGMTQVNATVNTESSNGGEVPIRELFGTPDDDDAISPEELAEYSRDRMLEPLMQRLQRQRTERGNTPFVYVAGEVNHPGVYPLVQNATARRLVAAAGGLRDSAYLQRAEITRINLDAGEAETEYKAFDLMDVILGNRDIELQGRDRLNVLSIPEWQNTYEVTLRGEVRFPGTYAIRRGEDLSALIERAGGFTDFAFLEGAVFTREELREQERRRMTMLAEELQREIASNSITGTGGSNQSYDQMRTLLADLMSVEPVGRLIVDLPRILNGQSQAGDIQLKDGDVLHVPSRMDSISIMGEVQMATSYRFDRDLTVTDYINMSGGTKQKADTDRIYVVRANGALEPHRQRRGWFSTSGSAQLRPGDAIVVPLDTTYTENLELWSQVTGIIYNSAVALAAINGI